MRYRNIISSSFIAATLVALPISADENKTSEKYQVLSAQLITDAKLALTQGKEDDAQLMFERALVANPANVEALIGLGNTYEAKGQTGRGLRYYRQALELDPNDKTALQAQSLAFLKQNLYDRAELNRDKLARLCAAGCDALNAVEIALEAYRAEEADKDTQKIADAGEVSSN
ncbi:tetratricopeptide repeat protein [Kordiimonas sp. SCSIO 12610]|uniref:tetratricopeptide repeat protein n=1 Tax=Kordiimonas sp. SCSIO 12610 TaxID=2829597 RepID=UPI00210AB9C9|nr:tetratricopeptide repeat protein [Kordiimonas sp. SCSIO 12610]UTW53809.1 tetratricopeptide repeat protein [Kordiimonas sp. SCSIO 12610]